MMMVAITGTRQGLSLQQKATLELWLAFHPLNCLCHGAAYGTDEYLAVRANEGTHVIAFPCNLKGQTSEKAIQASDEVFDAEPPLERNRAMVDYAMELIAFPRLMEEEQRSGTWATIRYARRRNVPVTIFWPDGTTTKSNLQESSQ